MTEAPVLDLPYRIGVGIMLINRHGLVWVGRRQPKWAPRDMPPFWQMPQGGIAIDEQPQDAARRELQEETGIADAEVITKMSDWLTYDLPPHLVGKAMKGRYSGQRQLWFAMRFNGPDSAVSIQPSNRRKAEFDAWQWVTIDEVPGLVVSFKRPMYETICREFWHFARR